MKRIISAFVLLLLCVGICVYGSIATEKKTRSLINLLNEAEYSVNIGDREKALISLRRLENEWSSAEKFFSSVSETALIDELDLSVGSLEKYILSDMEDEALVIMQECRTGLETIMRRQKISVENIL
ncbi:MAG: DUF4363 family protein [Clostridia bacterium]|nr:DUF4363 family protein [Clostridia bacterium]